MSALPHIALILALTLLPQPGGLAWAGALYALVSISALQLAPAFRRVPLPCTGDARHDDHIHI